MRDFNTAGPVRPTKHYCIPPLDRLNLREVLALIRKERYFVLHAPRQTGKTSALLALRDLLNGGTVGDYRCVYVNVETAQTAREVECKLVRSGRARTMEKGLEQTAAYMDTSGADGGHLVLFDMREGRSWEDRIFREERTWEGRRITVWGA